MSLISKISTILAGKGIEFLYDSGTGINQMIDNSDFSDSKCVVYSFLLSTSTFEDGKESANIGLFFSKLTEFDFNSIENDTIQDECKQVAFDFLEAINNGNMLTYSDVTLTRFYDEFSVNVTGVAINATFSEVSGLNSCFVRPIVGD